MGEWIPDGAGEHGIPVYGGLSWKNTSSITWRRSGGAAYRLWDEGVDGPAHLQLPGTRPGTDSLREIGEPEMLAGLDKMYQVDLDRKRVGYMNERASGRGKLPLSFATQAGPAPLRPES